VATAAFKADPAGFLDNAMILAPIGNAQRHNRSEHLGLEDSGFPGVMVGTNAAIRVWQVVRAQVNESYFRSYIADYEQGKTTFTTLGTGGQAEFCFTANMNGCTFGLGSQATDGTLLVSHGNAANTGQIQNFDPNSIPRDQIPMVQTHLQYLRALRGHGPQGRVFAPEHYRVDGRQAVTFGHRPRGGNGAWFFYFVAYTRLWGTITSYGVGPMQTTSLAI